MPGRCVFSKGVGLPPLESALGQLSSRPTPGKLDRGALFKMQVLIRKGWGEVWNSVSLAPS